MRHVADGPQFSGTPPHPRALTGRGGPGGFVAMRQMWGQLWKPPAEALDSLTSVLSEHWRKARERTVRLFWPAAASWLDVRTGRGRPGRLFGPAPASGLEALKPRAPVTTSPAAEDSSGTPPDPHRC